MKTICASLFGLFLGALIVLSFHHATAAELLRDPISPITKAINALIDTLTETDPSFRERFLKNLEAAAK